MLKPAKIVLIASSLISIFTFSLALSAAEPHIDCTGLMMNDVTKKLERVELAPASYDPLFLTADLQYFGLAADTWHLNQSGGVGLIIYNNNTHQVTKGVVGFTMVKGGKAKESMVSFNDPQKDGSLNMVQVRCLLYPN